MKSTLLFSTILAVFAPFTVAEDLKPLMVVPAKIAVENDFSTSGALPTPPFLPISDPYNGALKRPTQKANSLAPVMGGKPRFAASMLLPAFGSPSISPFRPPEPLHESRTYSLPRTPNNLPGQSASENRQDAADEPYASRGACWTAIAVATLATPPNS
jgi:hypothetical protein